MMAAPLAGDTDWGGGRRAWPPTNRIKGVVVGLWAEVLIDSDGEHHKRAF